MEELGFGEFNELRMNSRQIRQHNHIVTVHFCIECNQISQKQKVIECDRFDLGLHLILNLIVHHHKALHPQEHNHLKASVSRSMSSAMNL